MDPGKARAPWAPTWVCPCLGLLFVFFIVFLSLHIILSKNSLLKFILKKNLFILYVCSSSQFTIPPKTLNSNNFAFNILKMNKYVILLFSQLNPNENL